MPTRHIAGHTFSGVSLIALSAVAQPAFAATFNVGNETELAAAINTANSNGEANTINVGANITLTAPLPPLGLRDGHAINGNGNTVSGGGTQRISFANSGEIAINDVTLADGRAKGGNGGTGNAGESGGGGLGAGGALFVRGADAGAGTGASVTLSGVSFGGNQAVGGNGGADNALGMASAVTGGGGLGGWWQHIRLLTRQWWRRRRARGSARQFSWCWWRHQWWFFGNAGQSPGHAGGRFVGRRRRKRRLERR